MKCKRHNAQCPKGKTECFLCGDDGPYVENDKMKFEREFMVQHIQPGAVARTRGQYQRLLKRNGMTDDISKKELARLTMDTGKRESIREQKISTYLKAITPALEARAARLFR